LEGDRDTLRECGWDVTPDLEVEVGGPGTDGEDSSASSPAAREPLSPWLSVMMSRVAAAERIGRSWQGYMRKAERSERWRSGCALLEVVVVWRAKGVVEVPQ